MLKLKLTPLCMAICLTSGLSSSAFAADANTEELIQKINARTASLEAQIKDLKSQVATLKKQKKQQRVARVEESAKEKSVKEKKSTMQTLLNLGAIPVMTAPYIGSDGLQPGEAGHLVNYSGYNQDLLILKQDQRLANKLTQMGEPALAHPLLALSGKVVGEVSGYRGHNSNRMSDVNVDLAELDAVAQAGSWATAFLAVKLDNSSTTPIRTGNSRLFVEKAFVTIGNLNKLPIYGTVGQKFVPFGQYSNPMVTGPVTRTLGRVLARQISISYAHPGISGGPYATVYFFKGDTRPGGNQINNGGGTLGYIYKKDRVRLDIGVDYISNIADSQGMLFNRIGPQAAAAPFIFTGFGDPAYSQVLAKRVPGVDIHGDLKVGPYGFIVEYTGATTRFNPANMTFNAAGARPQAINVILSYDFQSWCKDSNIALNYGQTREALALNLPQQRWAIAYNVSIWNNTLFSIEFRRDRNYASTNVATGQGFAIPANAYGGYSNALTAQFGVYF